MGNNLLKKIITSFYKKMSLSTTHKERIDNLRKKGLRLGKNVIIHPNASIDSNFCFLISIGDNSVIARGVRLLAHDSSVASHNGGYGKLGRVNIKENCIISNFSVILPGVTIGPNVLVASGSVVNKDIPPNSCVAGVPARYYSNFDDFINKERENIKNSIIVDGKKLLLKDYEFDEELKNKIIGETEDKNIYMGDLAEVRKKRDSPIYRS
jgi:maltose O-acetyltransferase